MTKKEIISILEEKGVDFNKNDKKEVLEALLNEGNSKENLIDFQNEEKSIRDQIQEVVDEYSKKIGVDKVKNHLFRKLDLFKSQLKDVEELDFEKIVFPELPIHLLANFGNIAEMKTKLHTLFEFFCEEYGFKNLEKLFQ